MGNRSSSNSIERRATDTPPLNAASNYALRLNKRGDINSLEDFLAGLHELTAPVDDAIMKGLSALEYVNNLGRPPISAKYAELPMPGRALITGASRLRHILSIGKASSAQSAQNFTRSSLLTGRKIHESYRLTEKNASLGRYKEFTEISGIRPDFVDFGKKTIYELKPNNPRAIKEGWKQLERYKKAFEKRYPDGVWNTVLDLY